MTSDNVEDRPAKRRRVLPSRLRNADFTMHDKTLRDVLPQPLPPQPPLSLPSVNVPSAALNTLGISESDSPIRSNRILDTKRNTFGLFRRYYASDFPSHDAEANTNLSMLSNIRPFMKTKPQSQVTPNSRDLYDPYPNKNSFLLGEWYWAQGTQKSLESFQKLLEIIGSEAFSPADVRHTNWRKIDNQLAINEWDQEEWLDDDAGWCKSSIKIQVPFHRLAEMPGPREYVVLDFYHRSLVSVIKDKISNEKDMPYFHYDPHELYWQYPGAAQPICLYGELYTSSAFNAAHQDLQNMPGEPGCGLPRVIVALMFSSDGTHLTTFGHAKLWPLYMFFGNESKYRRCAPGFNLCEHVAYFEEVTCSFPLWFKLIAIINCGF